MDLEEMRKVKEKLDQLSDSEKEAIIQANVHKILTSILGREPRKKEAS